MPSASVPLPWAVVTWVPGDRPTVPRPRAATMSPTGRPGSSAACTPEAAHSPRPVSPRAAWPEDASAHFLQAYGQVDEPMVRRARGWAVLRSLSLLCIGRVVAAWRASG
ncbi:hypothetical protein [Streptomyces cellostaticus]|uniref:hypothetical protein n=1 Tax=Streptomyces cellostaticus TaxID=67285 RepID=UPI00131D88B3|nr:hypothetical protein [Streptomyces cellostaticus]